MNSNPTPTAPDEHVRGTRGPASFCIPQAALNALIEARADVVTIGAYLTLACGTEASGEYSTWGLKAVRERLSVDRKRGAKAIAALGEIRARAPGGELEPLVVCREALLAAGRTLPDGPTERGQVLHGLPGFGEALKDRVWFGSGLVRGFESFTRPLKTLKDCGSIAARLLLLMYQRNEMERFGGLPPFGDSVWKRYFINLDLTWGSFRMVHAVEVGEVADRDLLQKASGERKYERDKHGEPCWQALSALEQSGLIYPVLMTLNRNEEVEVLENGGEYRCVPEDADPLYELDCLSRHGYKPRGEEGIAGPISRTAGELSYAVTDSTGLFTGKYAAIAPKGNPLMVVGIYRLRFRVSNPLNVGVSSAWARIQEGNREGMQWLHRWRQENRLPRMADAPPSIPAELPDRRPAGAPPLRRQTRPDPRFRKTREF